MRFRASTWLWISLALIVAFALSPLALAIGAGEFGAAMGCRVDEGGAYPCLVLGADIGGLLNELFVFGWFMFLTIPLAGSAGLIWLGFAVWVWLRRSPSSP